MSYRIIVVTAGHSLYQMCNVCVALYSSYSWAFANGLQDNAQYYYAGLLLVSLAPLANVLVPFDRQAQSTTGVRLPKVSVAVMLGSIWMLLAVPEVGMALGLWLLCVGGFFISSYSLTID
ncbi:MAG: hypothetical protein OSA42_05205 [Porticoccaceae bacterium]|nr:hypothetical protein [Porticoccaceae bacterium]